MRRAKAQAVTVEYRDGRNGTRWAVCDAGSCLNHGGEWEEEPMPSSRTADFLTRCRWDSFEAALAAARACRVDA